MVERLFRVTKTTRKGPMVGGIIVEDGKIVDCAPYLRKIIGKRSLEPALDLLRAKDFKIEEIK